MREAKALAKKVAKGKAIYSNIKMESPALCLYIVCLMTYRRDCPVYQRRDKAL